MATLAGRRRLLAVIRVLGTREVSLRAHVHHSTVSRWASGAMPPSERARLALEAHCKIPRESWGSTCSSPSKGSTCSSQKKRAASVAESVGVFERDGLFYVRIDWREPVPTIFGPVADRNAALDHAHEIAQAMAAVDGVTIPVRDIQERKQ